MSSVAWNLELLNYSELLETNVYAVTSSQMRAQNACLRSSTFWMVVYVWRLLCPHMLMQFTMASVLCDKTLEYFTAMRFCGYALISFAALFSHFYYLIAKSSIVDG